MDRNEREPEPEQYEAGQCGSCHWCRTLFQFGMMKAACTVMPKQVVFAPNGSGSGGGQVITVAPVLENLKEGCSLWVARKVEGGT